MATTALVPITGTSVTTVTANVFVYDKKANQWISITPITTVTAAPGTPGTGTGGAPAIHTHVVADITDFPALATVAKTGEYSDLLNTPLLSKVAVTGEYRDVLNAPVLAKIATTGLWSDIAGAPTFATVATTGQYSDITGAPVLATVATSGDYADLINKPTIPTVAVKALTAGTNVTITELNGNYTINSTATGSGGTTVVQADWSATSGTAAILNKPTIPSKVSDLTNDSAFVDAAGAKAAAAVQSLVAGANVSILDDGSGNFTISATATGSGGTASGTVTSVSGTAPIHIATPTTTPVITIDDATSSKKGVLRYATAAEVATGTAAAGAIDPALLLAHTTSSLATYTAGTLKTELAKKANVAHTHVVADITDWPTFSKVATSGKYSDLTGTPALATVATSGDYADLINKPTIPTKSSELSNDLKWTTPSQAASASPVQSIVAGAHITVSDDGAGNFTINAVSAPSGGGGGGGGGVTNVTGSMPISVQNGSTTPAISVATASTTARGVVQLAESADVSAGSTGRAVDAALLKAELAKHALKSHHHSKSDITDFPAFSTVATTGKYSDLTGTPTIPAAQVSADWKSASGVSHILNKPNIPSKVSELTNDSSFVTAAQAKAAAPVQSVVAGTNVTVSETNGAVTVNAVIPAATKPDWTAAAGSAAEILHKPAFATVATSGSYADLTHKPTIPAAQVQPDWNATTGMGVVLNKPTIPAAQVSADWTATSGVAQILHKPALHAVATSGSYFDLKDRPTLTPGGGGSGTVTSVTGTAPIHVATGTTTPVVSVSGASTSAAGVVRFATLPEAGSGSASSLALTSEYAKALYAPISHETKIPVNTPVIGLEVDKHAKSGIFASDANSNLMLGMKVINRIADETSLEIDADGLHFRHNILLRSTTNPTLSVSKDGMFLSGTSGATKFVMGPTTGVYGLNLESKVLNAPAPGVIARGAVSATISGKINGDEWLKLTQNGTTPSSFTLSAREHGGAPAGFVYGGDEGLMLDVTGKTGGGKDRTIRIKTPEFILNDVTFPKTKPLATNILSCKSVNGSDCELEWQDASSLVTIPLTTGTGISIHSTGFPDTGIFARAVAGDATHSDVGLRSGNSYIRVTPTLSVMSSGTTATPTSTTEPPNILVNGATGQVTVDGNTVVVDAAPTTGTIRLGGQAAAIGMTAKTPAGNTAVNMGQVGMTVTTPATGRISLDGTAWPKVHATKGEVLYGTGVGTTKFGPLPIEFSGAAVTHTLDDVKELLLLFAKSGWAGLKAKIAAS